MCYHPLFVFNQFGHLERCAHSTGNVHSADGWKEVLDPAIARYGEESYDFLRLMAAASDAIRGISELWMPISARSRSVISESSRHVRS
jgi:hypothetical protein